MEAAREILARRKARTNLLDFTLYTKPDYETNWHHRTIARAIDRVVSGELKRLMVFVMPRSGKSELLSRRLPAYFLGRNPTKHIIACSYSSGLASRMNRDVQRIMESTRYRALFPDARLATGKDRGGASWARNSELFEVVEHGGSYRSAGVGTGITGMGADLILVDDYLKSAAEARSQTIRDNQWEWYVSDLATRQMPGCAVIVVCTRWHFDDIPGRLLRLQEEEANADHWEVIRLPAFAEDGGGAHPDDQRRPGEVLWSRYPAEFLEAQRTAQGPYIFSAMYQQRPTPREGGMFTLAGLSHYVGATQADAVARVRYWDKGYSAEGDWTVGCRMAKTAEGFYFLEDVVRIREHPHERDRIIKATAEADDALFGQRVAVYIEQPPGAGTETTKALIRKLAGHKVQGIRPVGAKEERAEPFAAQVEAGNVRIVRAAWNRPLIDELLVFPHGENDDQVDACSGAFNALANMKRLTIGL